MSDDAVRHAFDCALGRHAFRHAFLAQSVIGSVAKRLTDVERDESRFERHLGPSFVTSSLPVFVRFVPGHVLPGETVMRGVSSQATGET